MGRTTKKRPLDFFVALLLACLLARGNIQFCHSYRRYPHLFVMFQGGSSVDGDESVSRVSRASTNTSTAAAVGGTSTNNESASFSPPPMSPLSSRRSSPAREGGGGVQGIAEAVAAAGTTELLGPWGHGTEEDEARAQEAAKVGGQGGARGSGAGEGVGGGQEEAREEEVPAEPDAGDGVGFCSLFRPGGEGGGGGVLRERQQSFIMAVCAC